MRISVPHRPNEIITHKKGWGRGSLYVVMCRYRDGSWGIADFWKLPYVSTSYFDAVGYRREIEKKAAPYEVWGAGAFLVVKIEL